ncbi:MAG: Flp pilus assembly protein CpaB [Chloroflexota bacterium]|nr:MAG: Flp pilus assembly protein CpaB [Chloroflexota bacterium]
MKSLGGKRVLVLALLAAVLTSAFMWNYMQKVGQGTKPIPMASVLIATRDVPVRTRFAEDMFVRRDIPAAARHPNAATNPDQIVDKVTKLPISAGEQLLSNKFFMDRAESGLAFIVPPGKRAVSVAVSEVIGSGGLIVPGDQVDVVGVFDDKALGQDAAMFVLQKVDVLAVAQQLEGEAPPPSTSAISQATQGLNLGGKSQATPVAQIEPKSQPTAKTATLAVEPSEALRLIIAEERGKIRLVLRPAKDQATADLPPVYLRGLRPAPVSSQPTPAPSDATSSLSARAVGDGGGVGQ